MALQKSIKSKVKKALGMQRTVDELYYGATRDTLMQVVSKTIKPFTFGSDRKNPGFTFVNDKIIIMRVSAYSAGVRSLTYFDEITKAPKAIIVPNDFLFKNPTKKGVDKILKQYGQYMMKHLSSNCHWADGKIGCDPEIFAEDEKGELIPAFDFLGSKEKPSLAPSLPRYTGGGNNPCYWDGFQAEFTTHADNCMGYHGDSIQAGVLGVWTHLKKHNSNAKLSAKTVVEISPELLKNSKPEHVQFGCMPSLNIYGMKGLDLPGAQVTTRCAGGHIHLGVGKLPKVTLTRVIKSLDAVLGVAGVSLFAKYDDPRRRELYGLAGEYRLPPHGLEYRVLSNAWLFHPLMANIVFDLARGAYVFGKKDFFKYWDATEKETLDAINNCNVELAREILARNKDLFIQIINIKYQCIEVANFVYDIIINGADSAVKDMTDIEGNWSLGKEWRTHCGNTGATASNASYNRNAGVYYAPGKGPKV